MRTLVGGGSGDEELKPGMVMGIEPLICETGHVSVMQNKDKVAVAESGCFLLSDHTDTTDLLVSGVLKAPKRAKICDLTD